MLVPVGTLVVLCSLIEYSAGVGSYDAEGVKELLAELREELKEELREELTVILKQQNETHQQQIIALQQQNTVLRQQVETLQLKDKAVLQELELQQKTNEELQATVYSLLKAVRIRNISAIIL